MLLIVMKRNVWAVLLAGALSMFFAEVVAGSSTLWFIDPWALLTTYPLYLAHLLFYLNLAHKKNRFSLPHLYLWGMLFALYEAPITQVLWKGYMNEAEGARIVFLGVASIEFIVLVLFWHPIMSFMLPVLFYEALAIAQGGTALPGHGQALTLLKNKKKILFAGACVLPMNPAISSGFNAVAALLAFGGSIAIIKILEVLTARRAKKGGVPFGIEDLLLTRRGFVRSLSTLSCPPWFR
jgi:hypothetical protein